MSIGLVLRERGKCSARLPDSKFNEIDNRKKGQRMSFDNAYLKSIREKPFIDNASDVKWINSGNSISREREGELRVQIN